LNAQNVLEPTKRNRAAFLDRLRQRLGNQPSLDPWVAWGRWFLAEPAERTISPFSKMTLAEYLDPILQAPTAEALAEAEELAGGNPVLLEPVAEARGRIERTGPAEAPKAKR
jgi:hypothetical protein